MAVRRRETIGQFLGGAADALKVFAALSVYVLLPRGISAPDPNASITVVTREVIGKVNPWVFGNNMLGYQRGAWDYVRAEFYERGSGIWDPDHRRSTPEFVALARDIGLSVSRWPGGCAAHRFDWKKTVGSLAARNGQIFGLPEFLQNCGDIGAVPLITLAEYFGTAQDAADLIEYLNAAADGKRPWAAMRAADGHPAPWNVVWFEYGNESEHGDHKGHKMTAQEYARSFLGYQRAMKAVDPRIKLGAVIATGFPALKDWARPVLEAVGRDADFVIHHSYKPAYASNEGKPDANTLFAAGLAVAEQIQDYYDEMNALISEITGRRNLPIAVTEFNGHFVQERPTPYRHCLGNALVNAEMLHVFLRPRNNIVMANFWQFANEYWGQVKGYPHKGEPIIKRPQYFPFALYHNHFGPELVAASVQCGTYETDGGYGVAMARGQASEFRWLEPAVPLLGTWKLGQQRGIDQRMDGDALVVDFNTGDDVNYFHARKFLSAEPNSGYRLTGWVKTEALTSSHGACFQIGDARGYPTTKSAANTPDVVGTKEWTQVEVDYVTLPDTRQIEVVARRISGGGPVSGRAFYRDVRIRRFVPKRFAAVPYLDVNASRDPDGGKAYLMIVNKRLDGAVTTTVRLEGLEPRRAQAWTLGGPSVDATNEKAPDNVAVDVRDLGSVTNGFTVSLPPHSLTALEVEGRSFSGVPAPR